MGLMAERGQAGCRRGRHTGRWRAWSDAARSSRARWGREKTSAARISRRRPRLSCSAATSSEPEYVGELERLAQLRDQGILSEEEFEAKKKQLLGI